MEFEWDEEKARANLAKHGVSFRAARKVFNDPDKIDDIDDLIDYGEERWVAIGLSDLKLCTVVYVFRNGNIRIISARGASRHEEQDYYKQAKS
jgi:uncharacterized protein